MPEVFARIDANLPAIRRTLEELIRIPSVSADRTRAASVRASADAFARLLRDCGARDVEVLAVPDAHPIVCGDFVCSADAPTLLVYGHHDVQPPGRAERWLSPPFEPVERDGRLFGRGSVDDKGGIVAQIAAARAWMDEAGAPPCNVRFLIEGEEEIGSPNLQAFFEKYPERIACDVVALCDTPNFDTGIPALTYRLRGNCLIDVEVRTLARPLHSGRGGGAVPDPIRILCAPISRRCRSKRLRRAMKSAGAYARSTFPTSACAVISDCCRMLHSHRSPASRRSNRRGCGRRSP